MLAEDIHKQSAASLIDKLPCGVQLPEKLEESFELSGSTPSMPDENRRFPRVRCRSIQHRAGLQHRSSYPSIERSETWSGVYLADFSKSGLQVIHSEQLYPGEHIRVMLRTGNSLELEVIRCRRLGKKCYSIGAQILRPA